MPERYQPMQPVEVDPAGVHRFRDNKIVRWLLDNGGLDMNDIARQDFPTEDRDQFLQLIGYSVSAAPMSSEAINAADTVVANGTDTDRARIAYLEGKLQEIKNTLREPIATLFNIHPDDLGG